MAQQNCSNDLQEKRTAKLQSVNAVKVKGDLSGFPIAHTIFMITETKLLKPMDSFSDYIWCHILSGDPQVFLEVEMMESFFQ